MRLALVVPCLAGGIAAAAREGTAGGLAPAGRCAAAAPGPTHTVVLLHGLGRTPRSMRPLERRLARCGYRVVNVGYPSRSHAPDSLVAHLHGALQRCCSRPAGPVHVVTHSYGGILLRATHARHPVDSLGRVVMLAPPSGGSELVDRMQGWLAFRVTTGPVGRRLGTGGDALPAALPPVDFELGVIAGDRTLNPLFSRWIPGPDDGKVAVARARVPGMRDFLVVPHSHTWMMRRARVGEAVERFLARGAFE